MIKKIKNKKKRETMINIDNCLFIWQEKENRKMIKKKIRKI